MSVYPEFNFSEFNFSEIDDNDIEAMRRWAMRGHPDAIEDLALVADIRGEMLKGRQWRETLKHSISGTKGGCAPRAKVEDRHEDVIAEYENLRRHVSIRGDASRIHVSTGIPFGTVRRIISEYLKKT